MELAEAVARRRMVRRYRPDPVDAAALERIVAAFGRGPSAGFAQGIHLVVVTDAPARTRIAARCGEDAYVARGLPRWVSTAPVHLIPCVAPGEYRARYAEADKQRSRGPDGWRVPFWWVDGGAALMLALLTVVDEGLAAGFLDIADVEGLRADLDIPDDVAPLGLVTVGHPAPDDRVGSRARGRRPPSQVVHRDRW